MVAALRLSLQFAFRFCSTSSEYYIITSKSRIFKRSSRPISKNCFSEDSNSLLKISMSLVTFRLWFRVIQLSSDDLDLVYYLTFEWRWRSWTLYYVQELTFTSRKILFYALHSKWLDIIYSNAAHPILCEGWYFTYMWKTLNWPHRVTKIGR
jgi:hypothetical protein